jgi:hypothetical protein
LREGFQPPIHPIPTLDQHAAMLGNKIGFRGCENYASPWMLQAMLVDFVTVDPEMANATALC